MVMYMSRKIQGTVCIPKHDAGQLLPSRKSTAASRLVVLYVYSGLFMLRGRSASRCKRAL